MELLRKLSSKGSRRRGMDDDDLSPRSSKSAASLSAAFLAQGMRVAWKGLTYTVVNNSNRKEKVTLLVDVSGFLRAGELTALMGPSGSGKTTLLDLLAGRKTVGTTTGQIRFGGRAPSPNFLRRHTGYVEQHDTLLSILTVEEMLLYTAELKRPVQQSMEDKRAAVEELITVLGLQSCRSVRIGSSTDKGISGGQCKRVNIGIALISNPRVLFLDEPVSGLDSSQGNTVISAVKSIAGMGVTVAATIHSPTSFSFSLCDQLLLLTRGRVLYFGPNGRAAMDYFRSTFTDEQSLRADGENRAEWITRVVTEAESEGRVEELAAAYAKSELTGMMGAVVDDLLQKSPDSSFTSDTDQRDLSVRQATTTPFWWALTVLLRYRTLTHYKSPLFLAHRFADKLVLATIFWTLYFGVGDDFDYSNIPNISCMLFVWTMLAGGSALVYLPALLLERGLYVRERNDGLYSVGTYLAAKLLEEMGPALVSSVIFSVLVFWTVKIQGSYLYFWLNYLCTIVNGIVTAYSVAAISPNVDVAFVILPVLICLQLFFAGLLLRYSDIPKYYTWAAIINFMRWAWGGLMANQFAGDRNFMAYQGPDGPMGVLEYYSFTGSKWAYLGYNACFLVVYTAIAYFALRYVRYVRR